MIVLGRQPIEVFPLDAHVRKRPVEGRMTEQLDGNVRSTLEAAADLGLTVMASASMLQSRLSRNLPDFLSEHLPGLDSDSQRAIQFVRSTPGITTALVGMSQPSHVEENLRLAGIAPAPADTIQTLLHAA